MNKKPDWAPNNLIYHYRKHPAGEDIACWCDLLGKHPGPVSIDDYRDASFAVIDECWLVFQASYRSSKSEKYEQRMYYIDQRQCLTGVHIGTAAITTCYHDHVGWLHQVQEGDRGKIEFLKKWRKKQLMSNPIIANPKIYKLEVDGRTRKILFTYVKEFSAPVRGNYR
jgi:hypothetical protein